MKKSFLVSLILVCITLAAFAEIKSVSADKKGDTPEEKNIALKEFDRTVKNCREKELTQKELSKIDTTENFFADEPIAEKKRIECMQEQIKIFALAHFGPSHWQEVEKQLHNIEQPYIDLYRVVRCPTWPGCPQSGRVLPYMDFSSLLEKLLFDMYVSTYKLI